LTAAAAADDDDDVSLFAVVTLPGLVAGFLAAENKHSQPASECVSKWVRCSFLTAHNDKQHIYSGINLEATTMYKRHH